MKKIINIQLHNGETLSHNYINTSVTRSKQFQLISSVTITLENDSYIIIKPSTNSITLFTPSTASAYNNRLMQYPVKSLSANNKNYKHNAGLSALNTFVNSFNIEQAVQREFLKANNIQPTDIELIKSSEVMIPSFLNQLENSGYTVSEFTTQQQQKLSTVLLDFIANTGDVLTQKTIFQNFTSFLKNNNKR